MILVSGGNGNIGRAVCNELGSRGYEVISIGRRKLEAELYTHVSCDMTDPEALKALFDEYHVDIILHLAGLTNTAAKKDPLAAVKINIDGSAALLNKALEYQIPFVYGSSVNAVGLSLAEGSYKETDMSEPQEFYGWTKRFVEEMGAALHQTQGLDFTALRIPTVMGPGQGSVNTPWREACFTQVGKGGDLHLTYREDCYLPAIHIADLVNAICAVLTAKERKQTVYNLPAERLQVRQLKMMLEKIDPGLNVSTGEVETKGMCSDIDWSAFAKDFPIEIKTIEERLLEAKRNNEIL